MVLLFSFLALAGLLLNFKHSSKAVSFLTLLLIMAVGIFLLPLITPEGDQYALLGIIGIFLATNFILGSFIENKWLKIVLPLLSVGLLAVLGSKNLFFSEYSIDFSSPKTFLLPVLGMVALMILELKLLVLPKFIKTVDISLVEKAVVFILLGFFILLATFLASWFGIYLLALGIFAYNSYATQNRNYITLAFIGLSTIAAFMHIYSVESIDLSIGKLMTGLFVGIGALALTMLNNSVQNKLLGTLFALVSAGLLTLVLILNGVHPAYGGIEAFLAAIIGLSIGGLAFKESYGNLFLLPMAIVIGLTLSNDPFKSNELTSLTAETEKTNEVVEEKDIVDSQKGQEWSGIEGDYTVDPSSVISFQLGPKGGITKGEIKNFEGKITLTSALTTSKFEITLPVANLSTFNAMRDESLMDVDYFNEPKFPMMKFVATSMQAKEDGYVLKGNFTMLGKTNPQEVFIKYTGIKDDKKVFVGKASIDRTTFGMPSSPQEGDIVDILFQLLLIN